ncbi:alcohol dehydrogenase catalytic domain-containing protein [Nitrospina watsonii]|uniref:Threonine dehydrogenase and related Zn-dependent dehydrogenases n=1 Tax=Nitrospina watsonii TaxID=1323948 RepID=A0ABN8VVX5_9BACT|nr:alcohol dehydrogenase catalytic domain-containing protein [Nitrospina watsonii]CAI2717940.1 Threonine dehydrogenase and related Zn-dependent dehydrogenases [Nitrospina watsonii]
MSLAATLTAPKTLVMQDRPAAQAGPGEVVIAVEHAGVCGTDLALYSGDYSVPLPLVCGHEFVGRVTATGEKVDTNWKGHRVTAEINNTCTAYRSPTPCRACQRGMPSHCQTRTVTGIISKDGAFAEEVVVPAGVLHRIPDGIDPIAATLIEPLAAALQTFVMTPPKETDVVAVLGPGRLGILIVFVAAVVHGLDVIAVSRSESKRTRALEYGAALACAPEQAGDIVRGQSAGLGADIVIDATGQPQGFAEALGLVRPRGTISAKTTCGLPAQGLDMTRLVVDELCVQGSRCGPFAPAVNILEQHQDRLKTLITSVQPLQNAHAAIESAFHENKVVLSMQK